MLLNISNKRQKFVINLPVTLPELNKSYSIPYKYHNFSWSNLRENITPGEQLAALNTRNCDK